MRKHISKLVAYFLASAMILSGCSAENGGDASSDISASKSSDVPEISSQDKSSGNGEKTSRTLPQELEEIPQGYFSEAKTQGRLEELTYDTYESSSYADKTQKLTKRAIVYLPYGYSDGEKYDILYFMHGGWGNETVTFGTPDQPTEFKNVVDNLIADEKIKPVIIVCPTYNNTSSEDSGDFSLAM